MKLDSNSGDATLFHFKKSERKRKLLKLEQHFKVRHSVISYLINVDWNSIRLSFFFLVPVSLRSRLLKSRPFGNTASSQSLSSSLFHHPVDFHLFQRQKDEAFGGERTAFGTNCNDGKRLNLHYPWSYRKGRKIQIKHLQRKSPLVNHHDFGKENNLPEIISIIFTVPLFDIYFVLIYSFFSA